MEQPEMGRALKALRLRLGLSQETLARRMGYSLRAVATWERGDKPGELGEAAIMRFLAKHEKHEAAAVVVEVQP